MRGPYEIRNGVAQRSDIQMLGFDAFRIPGRKSGKPLRHRIGRQLPIAGCARLRRAIRLSLLSIEESPERGGCLFECRTDRDDGLSHHEVVNISEMLDLVPIFVTCFKRTGRPSAAEHLFAIMGGIRGIGCYGLALSTGIPDFPNRSHIRRRTTKGSNVGDDGLAGIDESTVRLEDGRRRGRGRIVLSIEGEDAFHAQSGEDVLALRSAFQGFGKEDVGTCQVDAWRRVWSGVHDRQHGRRAFERAKL